MGGIPRRAACGSRLFFAARGDSGAFCRYKAGSTAVPARKRCFAPRPGCRGPMAVTMPAPDEAVLARRDAIVNAMRVIVPGEGVIAAEREMRPYESDGLTAYRALPMV